VFECFFIWKSLKRQHNPTNALGLLVGFHHSIQPTNQGFFQFGEGIVIIINSSYALTENLKYVWGKNHISSRGLALLNPYYVGLFAINIIID
jgi:hypothetical protein